MTAFLRAIVATTLAIAMPGGAGGAQTNAATSGITTEGVKIEVPGADGCFIYVTAWENGSWLDRSHPDGARLQQGTARKDPDTAKRDVAEMKHWLEILLAQSSDMRDKVKAACEASAETFIQVALVRDDPEAGPGTAFLKTPLIVVDVGDTEKLGQSARTSSETADAGLAASSRQIVTSYLPVSIIVHEIDHMRRKNEPWGEVSMEYMAIDDENRVAVQLEAFKPHKTEDGFFVRKLERISYSPLIYKHRPFRDKDIYVQLDPAGSGLVFERRQETGRPRFADLSDHDHHALDGVPSSQQVEPNDGDVDGMGNAHDNCPHAWNPRQHDGNGDGTGDACDPEVTEEHKVTDSLVASAVEAVNRAASLAGGAPHLALIGPDETGGIRFVRLAEIWPFADPFGIFRTPGIGDRYLDSWIRAAISLRLTLHLFADPFGILSAAGSGLTSPEAFRSASTAPRFQVFAGRFGTFLPGSAFGRAIIIPVWVPPPPVAARSPRLGPWIAPASHRAVLQSAAGVPRQAGDPPRPSVKLFFVSTGQTTGTAFKMTAVNDGNVPVWLMLNTFALKPLANVTAADVERQMKTFAGRGRVTMDVDGYCLDFPKEPPPPGMVFGLADERVQVAMDPIDKIAHAVVRLRERGRLEPDTEDAGEYEYAHDMVQWSIWTVREGFDQRGFTRAFVAHVRKNFAAAGDPWTREMEQAVTALAPQRWTRIQTILQDAGVRVVAPRR